MSCAVSDFDSIWVQINIYRCNFLKKHLSNQTEFRYNNLEVNRFSKAILL